MIRARKKESAMTGMHHALLGNRRRESAEFAEDVRVRTGEKFRRYGRQVDGIVSGGYFEHPWNHPLHQPYLEAGLPNLINRPFANSMAKARKMIDTARKHGATILCPSA
jgi:hypothetical protein